MSSEENSEGLKKVTQADIRQSETEQSKDVEKAEVKKPKRQNLVSRRDDKQLAYLSNAIYLEEAGNPKLIRRATHVTMATVALFLAWAAFTPVDELSKGQGEIVPSASLQTVQHYEGGIVEDIYVEDGQFVEQGALLVSLNPVGADADLEAMRVEGIAMMLESERLRAYTQGRDVNFEAFEKDYPALVEDNRKVLESASQDRAQQLKTLDKKIAQEQERLSGMKQRIDTAREKRDIAKEEFAINERLYKKGNNSKIAYLNAKKEYARARDNLTALNSDIKVSQQSLEQAQSERAEINTRFRQQAYSDLAEVERKYATLIEKIRKLEDRSQRLDIVSPTRGIVKGLNTKTVGAVVAPGGEIAQIVPIDQSLIVETKLSTRDIGHIAVGQDVNVKVDSYDFARYGGLKGTLRKISATTFRDEKTNEPYYKGRVELAQNYVGHRADRNPVLPGMTVQTDIITGEKSVMAYLLKPVALAASTAMSER